eukprot:3296608-Rhodomonas_salina.1
MSRIVIDARKSLIVNEKSVAANETLSSPWSVVHSSSYLSILDPPSSRGRSHLRVMLRCVAPSMRSPQGADGRDISVVRAESGGLLVFPAPNRVTAKIKIEWTGVSALIPVMNATVVSWSVRRVSGRFVLT